MIERVNLWGDDYSPTNPEINEAVAVKLGWRVNPNHPGMAPKWISAEGEYVDSLPHYCTDMAAAWEVVEHCRKLGPVDLDGDEDGYRFFCFNPNGPDHFGIADTAPMAICLAFLKLS